MAAKICPLCNLRPVKPGAVTCGGECGYVLRRQRYFEEKARREGNAPVPAQVSPQHTNVALGIPRPGDTYVSPGSVGRYRRIVCWPDTHLPYSDPRAVALALNIVSYVKPDLLVILGDVLDCSGFSRFPHAVTDPRNFLATELEEWYSLARALRDAAPDAERVFIRGNHEARIEKWLWSQPQLTGYDGFGLGSLLKLTEFGFRPNVVEELDLCQGELTIRHGTFIGGNFAGTAARQEMARAGTSGISAHTHRAAEYIQRDKTGLRVWLESGHLAMNPPHYAHTVQNWCQAITVGEVATEGNDFDIEVVPFRLSYKARVHGKELSA